MDAEGIQLLGSEHNLQFRLGAAWAGDHERRDALVEETPFGNGDSVQSQIHYLMIFFILLASLIRDSIFFSSKSAMASRNDFILSR